MMTIPHAAPRRGRTLKTQDRKFWMREIAKIENACNEK